MVRLMVCVALSYAVGAILKAKRMREGVHERLRSFGHRYCSMLILTSGYHSLSMLICIMSTVAGPANVLLEGTAASLPTGSTP